MHQFLQKVVGRYLGRFFPQTHPVTLAAAHTRARSWIRESSKKMKMAPLGSPLC
jgi:hypothetical protein